jgi:hypothetical protein
MTLIDPRAGVVAALGVLSAETGVRIDGDLVASRLGPPLEWELANWFPADRGRRGGRPVQGALSSPTPSRTRPRCPARWRRSRRCARDGAKAVVVTAKQHALAVASLAQVGIVVDEVVGWRHGPAKGETLREHGATAYVGDHVADVDGARAAGAVSVAVASGPCSVEELRAYGADVVLGSLDEFGDWWRMAG